MRRNPVLLIMSLLAGVNAILAVGTLQDLVPAAAFGWITLILAGAQAAVQFWVRGQVTPLDSPRDRAGVPLVPHEFTSPPAP